MSEDEFDLGLEAARDRLGELGRTLRDGGPWPLAERFDHSPEAAWGPREILAHLAEMLPYWLGEAERLIDMANGPEPFGRDATNNVRLAIIERDRTLPIRELEARVAAGIERWQRRWPELDESARSRRGLHPALGEISVTDVANRFVARHLQEHLGQLAQSVGGGTA